MNPIKRIFDLILASILLLVFSIPMIIIALMNTLLLRSSPLFIQKRVGYKNKIFEIWKFKTMKDKQNDSSPDSVSVHRVTPFGKILRISKLDELPQLLNIIKGDMSFVGPRPLMYDPDFISYPDHIQERIYDMKPGVTAFGSIIFRDESQLLKRVEKEGQDPYEFKKNLIFPFKGELELWYQDHWSFWVDVKIMILTAWVLLFPSTRLVFRAFDNLPTRPPSLRREWDKMDDYRDGVVLMALCIVVLFPFLPPFFWSFNNMLFIGLALFNVLSLTYLLFKKKEYPLYIFRSDWGWFIFIIVGFLSYFWSSDGSRVWFPLFAWSMFITYMLVVRRGIRHPMGKKLVPQLLFISFILIVLFHAAGMVNIWLNGLAWNDFFDKNTNHSASLLICLFPYFLFYSSQRKFVTILKLLSVPLILFSIYFTAARGVFIAFLIVLGYFLWIKRPKYFEFYVYSILCLGLGTLLLYQYGFIDLTSIPMVELYLEKSASRLALMKYSFQLLLEHPIVGVGLGNWQIEAFSYGVNHVPDFSDPNNFIRYRSHELISKIFAELGIIGGIAFVIPMVPLLKMMFRKVKNDNSVLLHASAASTLAYIVVSHFYCVANFFDLFFSGVQLIGFTSIGILSSFQRNRISSKIKLKCLLTLSIFTLLWFLYSKINCDRYNIVRKQIATENHIEAISGLKKMYHPTWMSWNRFEFFAPSELAIQCTHIEDYDCAEEYFFQAIQKAPFHEPTLLEYSKYLLTIRKDTTRAEEYLQRILNIQSNHRETNALLQSLISHSKTE